VSVLPQPAPHRPPIIVVVEVVAVVERIRRPDDMTPRPASATALARSRPRRTAARAMSNSNELRCTCSALGPTMGGISAARQPALCCPKATVSGAVCENQAATHWY